MTAPESFQIKAGAVEWRRVYFGNHPSIKAGARLTGTPTVTVTGSGPTLSSKQISADGLRVVFLVTAGATTGNYTITALASTDEAVPQTLGGDVGLRVY